MKKISNKIIALSFIVLFLFVGCTKDFENINTDPNSPTKIPPQYLLTSAEKVLMAFLWDEWWNGRFGCLYAQYFSQTSYTDESRYSPRDGVLNNYWVYFYAGRDAGLTGALNGGGMEDLQRIIKLNTDEDTKGEASASGNNNNQIAIAHILKVWMFQILTDSWGDIPYKEALLGKEYEQPAYTPQEDIYTGMFEELDNALSIMDLEATNMIQGDMIYGGDMMKWKKFANSLKMRLAMRIVNADEATAKAKILEAYEGAFESNADNAQFPFMDGVPNNNPLNENQKTRQDFGVAKTLLDHMINLEDPRTGFYANKSVASDEFVGFPYGMTNSEATPLSNDDFSMPGNIVYAPTAPGFYMNYDEVLFILAEAAHRWPGDFSTTAQQYYEDAIHASMEMWNMLRDNTPTSWYRIDNAATLERTLPDPITEQMITEYLEGDGVAWNADEALMLIGTQKYIALYPQGLQGWFEWRRLGHPKLLEPGETVTGPGYEYTFSPLQGSAIPRRMYYPSNEQSLNEASYQAAVASQGADVFSTHVWWDVPQN